MRKIMRTRGGGLVGMFGWRTRRGVWKVNVEWRRGGAKGGEKRAGKNGGGTYEADNQMRRRILDLEAQWRLLSSSRNQTPEFNQDPKEHKQGRP